MAIVGYDPFDDHDSHLKSLPDHLLRDIARNEAAERRYRLAAVEVLVAKKSPLVKHPDLQDLVHELEIELDGIEFEHPAPSGRGPLVASVTTETMFGSIPEETGNIESDGEPIVTATELLPGSENTVQDEQKETDVKKPSRRQSKKPVPTPAE